MKAFFIPLIGLLLVIPEINYCRTIPGAETFIFNGLRQNELLNDSLSQTDSLKMMVKKYYDLNLIMFGEDSQKEDIDAIFKLFTEDFEYVHPKYGGTYSREVLYKGYENNLKKGRYNCGIKDIKINKVIIGLNAVAVQRSFVSLNNEGDLEEGMPQMTLFEFEDGKISRIREFW